ncbi:MAG: Holliday junction branch migration protein RuvA [Clostridia bacterium]|nr:Holliday junction branch migration protein RuvA [Clostridia bacterium]
MFYYISGELVMLEPSCAVVDAGGVGYGLTISGTTCGAIAGMVGKKVLLYTHMSVREDAVELFGFSTREELAVFRLLIGVSGVGAKSAVSVLTQLTPEGLSSAVSSGQGKRISAAQGIGAKTAERIVLELKDKLPRIVPTSAGVPIADERPAVTGDAYDAAVSALVMLGSSRQEAQSALRGAPAGADTEELIRYALKRM